MARQRRFPAAKSWPTCPALAVRYRQPHVRINYDRIANTGALQDRGANMAAKVYSPFPFNSVVPSQCLWPDES